jgi:hypothetical protein
MRGLSKSLLTFKHLSHTGFKAFDTPLQKSVSKNLWSDGDILYVGFANRSTPRCYLRALKLTITGLDFGTGSVILT